jgi:hypothetical protein
METYFHAYIYIYVHLKTGKQLVQDVKLGAFNWKM